MLLGSVEIVHHKGSLSSHRTDINDSIALAIVSPLRCTWVNGPAPQTMYSILKLKKKQLLSAFHNNKLGGSKQLRKKTKHFGNQLTGFFCFVILSIRPRMHTENRVFFVILFWEPGNFFFQNFVCQPTKVLFY